MLSEGHSRKLCVCECVGEHKCLTLLPFQRDLKNHRPLECATNLTSQHHWLVMGEFASVVCGLFLRGFLFFFVLRDQRRGKRETEKRMGEEDGWKDGRSCYLSIKKHYLGCIHKVHNDIAQSDRWRSMRTMGQCHMSSSSFMRGLRGSSFFTVC
jgi:hypothetical protein